MTVSSYLTCFLRAGRKERDSLRWPLQPGANWVGPYFEELAPSVTAWEFGRQSFRLFPYLEYWSFWSRGLSEKTTGHCACAFELSWTFFDCHRRHRGTVRVLFNYHAFFSDSCQRKQHGTARVLLNCHGLSLTVTENIVALCVCFFNYHAFFFDNSLD